VSRFSAARVCKVVAAKQALPAGATLELARGDGYWYFILDDGANLYDTHSVMTMRLGDLSLDQWVDDGVAFVQRVAA
jgi:hypothetical protein